MKNQLAKATAETKSTETEISGEEMPANPDSPSSGFDLEGKLIIDLKDPNRPRFTLQELRQVNNFLYFLLSKVNDFMRLCECECKYFICK